MLPFFLSSSRGQGFRILCIGAHCDDIEIGCAATLMFLQSCGQIARIDWAVLSGTQERQRECESAWQDVVAEAARGDLNFGRFADGRFPAQYDEVKAFFETLKDTRPDVIFTHARCDLHQDHRIVNEMTWNTFRDTVILEYEVPKWDGDLGQPNMYVPVERSHGESKIDVLMNSYRSQAGRDWFTRDTFEALMRLRGVECRAHSGWAEAFTARKILFNPGETVAS